MGAKGLDDDEGGVLSGLSDGLSGGDLTIGTFAASCGSSDITGAGLMCGFSAAFGFLSGSFLGFAPGFSFCFFSVSTPNGKITGTNLLSVMPSGVSLCLFEI